jgi:hypothetical protein
MKLTWFGDTTLRVYLGGQIVVVGGAATLNGIDGGEVLAGADRQIEWDDDLAGVDAASWRPKPAPRALDGEIAPGVDIYRIGTDDLLLAAAGEPPLVVLRGMEPPRFGRWADGAVVVLLCGAEALVRTARLLLAVARPKLVVLAADEQTLDTAVVEISGHLDGAGLVSLEVGLAIEV